MPQIAHKTRSERTDEIRRRILDVSIELFLDNGYDKTTTRHITQKAGILNGSLYNIFRSKDEILRAAIMEALWDSIRESEKFIPDATFIERIEFPIVLQIYASKRSPRIAELLAIVHKKYEIMETVCDTMTSWIEEKDTGDIIPTGSSDFRLRMYACIGALGNLIEMFAKDDGEIPDREATYIIIGIFMSTFGLPTVDLKNRVDLMYDAIDTHDITICGVHV